MATHRRPAAWNKAPLLAATAALALLAVPPGLADEAPRTASQDYVGFNELLALCTSGVSGVGNVCFPILPGETWVGVRILDGTGDGPVRGNLLIFGGDGNLRQLYYFCDEHDTLLPPDGDAVLAEVAIQGPATTTLACNGGALGIAQDPFGADPGSSVAGTVVASFR